ncbi:MAG: NigD-like protein [Bacteroidota bacterium]|nr:NigD-like protein [Bacteroidota bacterium]
MKKINWVIASLLMGVLLVSLSCDDKSRSLGNFGIDIATVIPEGDNAYSLLLDNGKRLWPAASATRYAPTPGQRVFLNYTILSEEMTGYDHYVRVNDMWNILTKKAIELNAQNADSIGNDPVKANAMWVGGDYLNVSFMFNYGGMQPHAINLVNNQLEPGSDSKTINLEFRHNAYYSHSSKLYEGFVCFDLRPLRVENADSVKLSIKVKEWTGNKIYDMVYRYNQQTGTTRAEMPIPVISSNQYY